MELIVGARRIPPAAIHPIPGGVEAELRGDAVLPLLDAAFYGAGRVEILGGDMDRRPMDVAGIEMRGASTLVTLICAGKAAALH